MADTATAPVRTLSGDPSRTTARKVVLVSMLVLVILAIYRGSQQQQGFGTFRRVWGVAVLGFFLSVMADFAPQIAGPFAVLAVLGSFTNGGDKALQTLTGKLSTKG